MATLLQNSYNHLLRTLDLFYTIL